MWLNVNGSNNAYADFTSRVFTQRKNNGKKQENSVKEGFLDLNQQKSTSRKPLFSMSNSITGEFLSVYRDASYTTSRPVYQVNGVDDEGRTFHEIVDVEEVDLKNGTYTELAACAVYAEEMGSPMAIPESLVATLQNLGSFHERLDYTAGISREMAKQGQAGNWEEYVKLQKAMEGLNGLFVQKNEGAEQTKEVQKETDRPLGPKLPYDKKSPYFDMAEDGVIQYNGITFQCDEKRNTISLGDVSDRRNTLSIPLADGGRLLVNRDNLGDLAKAIGMFTPEDVNRIMEAITKDKMARNAEVTIEDNKSKVMDLGSEA